MRYVGMPAEQITTMPGAFLAGFEAVAPTLAYDHTAILGAAGAVPKHRLAAVGMPTLAMCGGSSPAFMCATARTISQVVSNGACRRSKGKAVMRSPRLSRGSSSNFLA